MPSAFTTTIQGTTTKPKDPTNARLGSALASCTLRAISSTRVTQRLSNRTAKGNNADHRHLINCPNVFLAPPMQRIKTSLYPHAQWAADGAARASRARPLPKSNYTQGLSQRFCSNFQDLSPPNSSVRTLKRNPYASESRNQITPNEPSNSARFPSLNAPNTVYWVHTPSPAAPQDDHPSTPRLNTSKATQFT